MPRGHQFQNLVDAGFGDDDDEHELIGDIGVSFSSDGHRRDQELFNVSHKKRRVQPSQLADSYAEWISVPDEDYQGTEDVTNPLDSVGSVSNSRKRKDYASSDNPMSLWRPLMVLFGDELVCHDGLGNDRLDPRCTFCKVTYGLGTRIFKCCDCGEFLQCRSCCLSRHEFMPLHTIKEWNGDFWVDTTLMDIGQVYQLGHGGFPCIYPDTTVHKMTVIEAPVIHQIRVHYCKCSKSDHANNLAQLLQNRWYPATVTDPGTCVTFKTLEVVRLYNIVGNMNVNDFIHAMERITNMTASMGMQWLPDRYKQLQRTTHQWAFLKRVKRTGRTHDPMGVEKTGLRELAQCGPEFRFLYMLLLAVNANFKLKNCMHANEVDDPLLGPGWSYWVEPKRYKRHLKKYVGEKDLSTCIAFAALLQKDTRLTTGLHASGVGGCICARHECVRPSGIGDLQNGERYANMDYIVLSALVGFNLLLLTISYDIACQWKKTLPQQNEKMPDSIRLPLDAFTYQCALLVWHAGSLNEDCQTDNSLSFKEGIGKSDGEGVEWVWSVLNPAAYHTKDAGRGLQVDSLEDKIDNHNFLKNIEQGDTLQRKLIPYGGGGCDKAWKKMILAWRKDGSNPNLYTLSRKEAQVRLEVKRDEDTALAAGQTPLQGSSATAFLVAGLQIEEALHRILAQLAGMVLLTADRKDKLHDWQRTLLVKIAKFHELQTRYMPGAARMITEAEAARNEDLAPPKPEKIRLYMPSQMQVDDSDPLRSCVKGLMAMETKLHASQCLNALVTLHARLHTKRHLITFQNANVAGQIQLTKAQTLIEQVGEQVEACAVKYRRAWLALIGLGGAAGAEKFQELRAEDIQLDGDAGESDATARKKLAMIGAARAPRNAPGMLKKTMSWIWTAPGMLDDEELYKSNGRARAWKLWWQEEVLTLWEEMGRVLQYLAWQSEWWRARVALRPDEPLEIVAGIRAYALKQADLHDRLAAYFQRKWATPAVMAARQLVAFEVAVKDESADLDLSAFFG
ncbi:hypothetical protein DFH07DRAFT_953027 [Mycena maculata]|uniref:CxC2-like cysteine cluster KDZ transposase-associated domain-containing protein n=1 Tax=Mycena maculata TaxID=230809 RepID=A0AAD7JVD1_9AGAR|nr:hypothetical protein DFH07DRAFT_953027 [Mycena maculata]